MRAAATLGTRAVAGARGHARMRKSEPVNVRKKFCYYIVTSHAANRFCKRADLIPNGG